MKKSLWFVILAMAILVISPVINAHWLEEEYDFGGEKVIFAAWAKGRDFAEGVHKAHLEEVEEKFNVKIEWVQPPYPGWEEGLTTYVLEGESNIVFEGQNVWVAPAAAKGLLYPLDDILDEGYYEALTPSRGKPMPKFNKFFGKTYGFQSVWMGEPGRFFNANAILWNKDLFAKEGLPNPYELYDKGEWTWENFKEIVEAAARDNNGDGEIDQWGFRTQMYFPSMAQMPPHNNGKWYKTNENGQVEFTLDEPAAIEAFDFYLKLHQSNDTTDTGGYPDWEVWKSGKLAMMSASPTWVLREADNGLLVNIDFDAGYLPYPKGPRADDNTAVAGRYCLGVLPITVENPKALIALWHEVHELTKYQEPFSFGPMTLTEPKNSARTIEAYEKYYWEDLVYANVPDQRAIETIEWMQENSIQLGVLAESFRNGAVEGFLDVFDQVMAGEIPPETGMAQVKPAAQAFLDEMLNN